MSNVSLTGKDIIKINGRIFNDFADGDCAKLTFPNKVSEVKTGKNGNSIFAFNYSGLNCQFELRILRGGSDDKFLNNLFALYKNNPPAFSLLTGEFIKNIGDGAGNITQDIYILGAGVFEFSPEAKENADADTEQAIVVWKMLFTNAPRSLT